MLAEFVIFVSTICKDNIIYAHVEKTKDMKNWSQFYVPIIKDCKKSRIIGIKTERGVKLK